ncbi:MAG: hypothetical protein K1X88_09090 [Nannocystaceae bacterium]|nr:hypothetical protein [Nannocystaceae bacterium]
MSWATTVCDRRIVAVVLALAGCDRETSGVRWGVPWAGSVGDDASSSSSSDGGVAEPMDGGTPADTDGPTLPKPGGSEGETDASTSDDATTGDDASTSGAPPPVDEPDSAGADAGVRPDSGPWSSCADGVCAPGLGCLQGESAGATCTAACVGFDPGGCPPPPGEVVTTICIAVAGQGVCALDCSGGLSCPAGMQCVLDHDDDGPIEVCL